MATRDKTGERGGAKPEDALGAESAGGERKVDPPTQKQGQGAQERSDIEDDTRGVRAAIGGDPNLDAETRENMSDNVLSLGDRLDQGRPPTQEEIEAAAKQAGKTVAEYEQEQADALVRQQSIGIGAQFQPPEGQKPKYVSRGKYVNPDARPATTKNLALNSDSDEINETDVRNAEEILARAQAAGMRVNVPASGAVSEPVGAGTKRAGSKK